MSTETINFLGHILSHLIIDVIAFIVFFYSVGAVVEVYKTIRDYIQFKKRSNSTRC